MFMVLATLTGAACTIERIPSPEQQLSQQAGGKQVKVLARRAGVVIGAYRDSGGGVSDRPCFIANGAGRAGGACMNAVGHPGQPGWALELRADTYGTQDVLLVAADPRVALVRIPRSNGGHLEVVPRPVGVTTRLLAVVFEPLDALVLSGNRAQAFDAQGRLLGTTHDCEGLGGPPDCGPYEGLIDEGLPRPSRRPS
jgi:hypothetical protein